MIRFDIQFASNSGWCRWRHSSTDYYLICYWSDSDRFSRFWLNGTTWPRLLMPLSWEVAL